MPQRPADLHRQFVVQRFNQVAHMVQHVSHVQPFAAAETRVDDFLQIFAAGNNHVVIRQRAMAQVVDCAHLAVGLHNPLGEFGQLLFEAKIGGHDKEFRGLGSVKDEGVNG